MRIGSDARDRSSFFRKEVRQMVEYRSDRKSRRRALLIISKQSEEWGKKTGIILLLLLMSVAILSGIYSKVSQPGVTTRELLVHVIFGGFIAFVPVLAAVSIRKRILFSNSSPYAEHVGGKLQLDGEILRYVFWALPTGDRAARRDVHITLPDQYKVVYEIAKCNIRTFNTEHAPFITITGAASLTQCADIDGKACKAATITEDVSEYVILDTFSRRVIGAVKAWCGM